MKDCHCGPRECLHPSTLCEGYQCKVVKTVREQDAQMVEAAHTTWSEREQDDCLMSADIQRLAQRIRAAALAPAQETE